MLAKTVLSHARLPLGLRPPSTAALRSLYFQIWTKAPQCRMNAVPSSPLTARVQNSDAYDEPRVYDIAFSFRDFESEAAFLLESHASYCKGSLGSFLEIGCGPARHCVLLAQAGVPNCMGLDASPAMISYAEGKSTDAGTSKYTRFAVCNMYDPQGYTNALSIEEGSVDMSAILLGTMSHCTSNQDAIQTLRNISRYDELQYPPSVP